MQTRKHIPTRQQAALLALSICAFSAHAQHDLPGGGWTYDPAKDGMKDLRALKPIEGCNVPGGLRRITSSDEPGTSAPFWCGPPPFCLTDDATPLGEQCTILPFSRREPRYDPNGRPGANGVRDPDDLRCVNTGLPPINGRCPLPPELSVSISPATLYVNQTTTLTINSPHATQLRMSCSGANAVFDPYHLTNLDAYAGRVQTFGASQAMTAGTTTCDVTASNARGSVTRSASFSVDTPPPPPPPPPPGGGDGNGDGNGDGTVILDTCYPTSMSTGYEADFCTYTLPRGRSGDFFFSSPFDGNWLNAICNGTTWQFLNGNCNPIGLAE